MLHNLGGKMGFFRCGFQDFGDLKICKMKKERRKLKVENEFEEMHPRVMATWGELFYFIFFFHFF